MHTYNFPLIITQDEHGFYVECPLFEWCYSQGNTLEEAKKNIQEVIEMCVEELQQEQWSAFSLTSLFTKKTTFFTHFPISMHVW